VSIYMYKNFHGGLCDCPLAPRKGTIREGTGKGGREGSVGMGMGRGGRGKVKGMLRDI
jgi:hypothetical protein